MCGLWSYGRYVLTETCNETRLKANGDRSFLQAWHVLCNKLASIVRLSEWFEVFKSSLKTQILTLLFVLILSKSQSSVIIVFIPMEKWRLCKIILDIENILTSIFSMIWANIGHESISFSRKAGTSYSWNRTSKNLTHLPRVIWMTFLIRKCQANFNDWWLHFLL